MPLLTHGQGARAPAGNMPKLQRRAERLRGSGVSTCNFSRGVETYGATVELTKKVWPLPLAPEALNADTRRANFLTGGQVDAES
jgi:hypothetical protein